MIILHPYGAQAGLEQLATEKALESIRPLHEVIDVPCGDDDRYEQSVKALWHRHVPFIICEHDIAPTLPMMDDLASCPESWCAQSYVLTHDVTTISEIRSIVTQLDNPDVRRLYCRIPDLQSYLSTAPDPAGVLGFLTAAHRVNSESGWRWIDAGETDADYVGFGLTKFTPDLLPEPGWESGSWRDLDSRVSTWIHRHGMRWHIHWPIVAHYHVLQA